MIFEIADCSSRINLEFDVDSKGARANSLYKLDTLVAALRAFRTGVEQESNSRSAVRASSRRQEPGESWSRKSGGEGRRRFQLEVPPAGLRGR